MACSVAETAQTLVIEPIKKRDKKAQKKSETKEAESEERPLKLNLSRFLAEER
jgi:hypothetical protein